MRLPSLLQETLHLQQMKIRTIAPETSMGIPLMLPIPTSRPIALRWTPLREAIEVRAAVVTTVAVVQATVIIVVDVERAETPMAIELLAIRRVVQAMGVVEVVASCLQMIPIGSSECPLNIGVSLLGRQASMLREIKLPQATRKAAVAAAGETTTVIPITRTRRNGDDEEDEGVEEAPIMQQVPVRTSRQLPRKPLLIPEIALDSVKTSDLC